MTFAFYVHLRSMKIWTIFLFTLLFFSNLSAQDTADSLPYTLYKERVVLFSDLGFNAAPFTLKDNFSDGQDKLRFKHNLKLSLGLGVMYKWFSLRIGFGLPGTIRPKSRFGNSQITDLGIAFSFKKTYWDIDARNYYGYAIVDANKWNDTLNKLTPNLLRSDTRAVSFSTNVWYFKNKHFKMAPVYGKVGHYDVAAQTWYFKGTLNYFGVGNEGESITPTELIDSSQTKSSAHTIAAVDIGVVPGYAYVGRINNWQFSAFGGLGAVIQSKIFTAGQTTRGLLGLAPRLDLRFIAGYSKPEYFVWFVTDFDAKSIRFQEMKYNQTFYSLKVVAGFRLDKKKKDKQED